jgi:GGDEF domain-containing protein
MKQWKIVVVLGACALASAFVSTLAQAVSQWGRVFVVPAASLVGMLVGLFAYRRLVEIAENEKLTDEQAGVYSWEFFNRTLKLQVGCSRRYGQPTSVLVVQVGPGLSPQALDDATARIARHLQAMCRNTDLIARCEDKVVALLTWTPAEPVFELAHRILASLQSVGFGHGRVGIGYASWEVGYNSDTLLERAFACAQHSLDLEGLRVVGPAGPQQVPMPYLN